MSIELLNGLWVLIANLIGLGITWGTLNNKMNTLQDQMKGVREALGLIDGGDAVFLRVDEFNRILANAEKEHAEFKRRLSILESKVFGLSLTTE